MTDTAKTENWTLGSLLNWTAKYLADKGAEFPRLDAEVLLAQAAGCKRIDLYGLRFAEDASPDVVSTFPPIRPISSSPYQRYPLHREGGGNSLGGRGLRPLCRHPKPSLAFSKPGFMWRNYSRTLNNRRAMEDRPAKM